MIFPTTTYYGSDLKVGMTWVDGYGYHYKITGITPRNTIQNGYLSIDYTQRIAIIRAVGTAQVFPLEIDNAAEYKVLDGDV